MLNGRLYRVAFVPFLFALAIAAFSLGSRPQPYISTLAPDAFEGAPAFAELQRLAREFPHRRPGSPGDEALGRYVAQKLEGLGGAAGGLPADAERPGDGLLARLPAGATVIDMSSSDPARTKVLAGTLAEAGVNLVPPAITIAGAGVLALGVWPRGTSIVLYALLGWSLLVVVIGGIGATSHWILDTSVFHQMASAPAVPPHWEADGVMAAIGVAGALIGGIAFQRRDLQGE